MHAALATLVVEEFEKRFWSKVKKSEGCWLWTGQRIPKGYGQFKAYGSPAKLLKAHRVSWEMVHGFIPAGMLCLHRCDTPGCVRPDHLFLGTNAENMADMARKGRARHGSKHRKAGLTEETVSLIRRAVEAGVKDAEIVKTFRVGRTNLYLIKARKAWKHVP